MATELPEVIILCWQAAQFRDQPSSWRAVCDVITGCKAGLQWADETEHTEHMVNDLLVLMHLAWRREQEAYA